MIHYINKGNFLLKHLADNGIFLYWLDGELQCTKPDHISDEQVNTLIETYNPWPLEKDAKLKELNDWLENQIQAILSTIPKSEQMSWPTQVAEARGIQPLSMLVGIALGRGISVEELKLKVLAKEKAFSDYYSLKQGERDRVEALVKALPDDGEYYRLPELWELSCMA